MKKFELENFNTTMYAKKKKKKTSMNNQIKTQGQFFEKLRNSFKSYAFIKLLQYRKQK